MKILVTGSRGLIGSALIPVLNKKGYEVTRLVRGKTIRKKNRIRWDPANGVLDPTRIEGFDAVVHLAGEGIAKGRWTVKRKAKIHDSRVKGTKLLSDTLARLKQPPKVLVSASAIGYYGDRVREVLNEDSPSGSGFLPVVCREWENATQPAVDAGIRVVFLRTGMVLARRGGALPKMALPFSLGLGGKVGNGNQFMSWISLDDMVGAIVHALETDDLTGPVNAVSPHPVTNKQFTLTLGKVLNRPTFFSVPAAFLRLRFGEMADALLLASTRVEPARLQASGYAFQHPELESALRHVLRKRERQKKRKKQKERRGQKAL